MRGIDEVALGFDAACRQAGVSYAFMGAMAVMAWGEPRATTDVDALVVLAEPAIPALVASLRARGFSVDPRDLVDAVRDGGHVSVFPGDGIFWVDLKVARSAPEIDEVTRAVEAPVRGSLLRLVGPEETVAFKLKFGSPKDVQDAMSILARQGERLDRPKLHALCARLRVGASLAEIEQRLAESARES